MTAKTKKVNLVKADGSAFTDALNTAEAEDLERALRFKGLPKSKRGRIEAALAAKRQPKVGPDKAEAGKQEATAKGETADAARAVKAGKKKHSSGLDAAVAVLREASEPLDTKTMVERMLAQGLWKTNGKTPASTIYAAIITEIAKKGAASRFRKVARGCFELTEAGKEAK